MEATPGPTPTLDPSPVPLRAPAVSAGATPPWGPAVPPPERFPRPLLGALLVGAVFMGFLTLDQSHWWGTKPDYAFGWIVPVFVGYVVHLRWAALRAAAHPVAPDALPRGWRRALDGFALLVLAGGLALFLLAALYRAGTGTTQPGSLALALGFAAVFPAMIYLAAPDGSTRAGPAPAGWRALAGDARLGAAALFLFPALIWILSAPLVSAVESALSLFLLRQVVAVVFTVFSLLGYPLVQEGNVLLLPLGRVGVADACSGIRSLTACLFAGSFLAVVSLTRWWQKVLLVGLALLLAFLTNLARSLFLTAWAYAHGSEAIEGRLHDLTGYAVLGLTVLGLLALLPLFHAATWRRLLDGKPAAAAQP